MMLIDALMLLAAGLALLVVLARAKKSPPPPVYAETPVGRFRKVYKEWVRDAPIAITVHDRGGAPDPDFVARLPELVADLPRLEALARAFDESAFDDGFALCGLDQNDEDYGLLFGAAREEQGDIGTLYVAFVDGKPVDATLVH